MSPEQFVYWLNGYFKISQHSSTPQSLNDLQIKEIKNHLKLVMTKITEDISKSQQLTLKDVLKHIPDPNIWPDVPGRIQEGRDITVTC